MAAKEVKFSGEARDRMLHGIDGDERYRSSIGSKSCDESTQMRKVLRGYAKDKNGNLILIGTMPVPFSKDKCAPAVREEKRHLVRQGATIFKKETIR